jgi:ClpP class serine protease
LMKAETWFTDQEAVEAGLADEVGRSNDGAKLAAKQIAAFDLSRFREGDRMVARLVTELVYGDVLPEETKAAAEAPEPEQPIPAAEPEHVDPITARKRAVDAILEDLNV